MLRRAARQRREYLFQKSTTAKESATYDRKRRVKEAVEQGKALPTEVCMHACAPAHAVARQACASPLIPTDQCAPAVARSATCAIS